MKGAIAAVVAVVAVVAGLIWLARPKDSGPDPKEWEAKASAAFKPLVSVVPDLVQGARQWQAGERSTEDFTRQVQTAMADFVQTSDRVAGLGASPKAKETGQLYKRSADLYVQVARIYDVMVRTDAGDLRAQLDLLARRTRELADRVFDQGHAALAPYLAEQKSPDVEVRSPEEVPIWPAEGLAAGPPLDEPPAPPASSPPLRQATRPEQPAADWEKEARRAGAPSQAEMNAAFEHRDRIELQALARRSISAAERLRGVPDPKGHRDRSAILRLSMLVEADAARASQAATFASGRVDLDLRRVGNALSVIGDSLRTEAGV